jgi:hypothetical protein
MPTQIGALTFPRTNNIEHTCLQHHVTCGLHGITNGLLLLVSLTCGHLEKYRDVRFKPNLWSSCQNGLKTQKCVK